MIYFFWLFLCGGIMYLAHSSAVRRGFRDREEEARLWEDKGKPLFRGALNKVELVALNQKAQQVIVSKGFVVGVPVVFEGDNRPVGVISEISRGRGQVRVGRLWYSPQVLTVAKR